MAHKTDIATIGHIFLTLGIFGYFTGAILLGYTGLILAVLCYAQQLLRNFHDYLNIEKKNKDKEEEAYSPMQTTSPEDSSIIV